MCIGHLRLLDLRARTASPEILSLSPPISPEERSVELQISIGSSPPASGHPKSCCFHVDGEHVGWRSRFCTLGALCSGLAGECSLYKGIFRFCKIRLSGLLLLPPAEPEQQRKLQAIVWCAHLRESELCSLLESVAAGYALHTDLPGCLPRRKCKLSSNDRVSECSQGAHVFWKDSVGAESLGVPAALLLT